MTTYYQRNEIAECYECGEKCVCEVHIAEQPDPETGYIDEWAICEHCKNGAERNAE